MCLLHGELWSGPIKLISPGLKNNKGKFNNNHRIKGGGGRTAHWAVSAPLFSAARKKQFVATNNIVTLALFHLNSQNDSAHLTSFYVHVFYLYK